jgi:hypothetical protein
MHTGIAYRCLIGDLEMQDALKHTDIRKHNAEPMTDKDVMDVLGGVSAFLCTLAAIYVLLT